MVKSHQIHVWIWCKSLYWYSQKKFNICIKEKPLPIQPLPNNMPSLPTTAYINAYLGPEKAESPNETREFFSKVKKYLEFTTRPGISLSLVYLLQKTLENSALAELEKLRTGRKKCLKWNRECKIKQVETTTKKLVENCRSNLKLKWNQQKKSHWFWWTLEFHKASHHVPGSTICVLLYAY